MLYKFADNRNPNSLASVFRQKRLVLFLSLINRLEKPVHILDIGGVQQFWRSVVGKESIRLTLLNLLQENVLFPNTYSVTGDGRCMGFLDKAFDVVFSNSVIEHVGMLADQEQMAHEIMRVGCRYFIQTPNRYFPLEPHYLFPLFQFLPQGVQIYLVRHFQLGWMPREREYHLAKIQVKSIRLLTKHELRQIFPDGVILEEKIFGFTKSFIVYGGWGDIG